LDEPQKEDVWAFGVTLYQLFFKELLFRGSTLFEIAHSIHECPLKIPEETDPAMAALLRGMLTVDPMSRLAIDDLLCNPLIRDAADRVVGLSEVPALVPRDGKVVLVHGEVCGDGYSFADVACQLDGEGLTQHPGERESPRKNAGRRG
jgi:serine/threonine protein kinase